MKVGDRIKDNDPRMGNRVLVIVEFEGEKVRAKSPHHKQVFSIARKRIHADGKPRRGGFDLMPSP